MIILCGIVHNNLIWVNCGNCFVVSLVVCHGKNPRAWLCMHAWKVVNRRSVLSYSILPPLFTRTLTNHQMSTDSYKNQIAGSVLGKHGDFPAYFGVYDRLFSIATGSHIVEIDNPSHLFRQLITHGSILSIIRSLKTDNKLTLNATKEIIKQDCLPHHYSPRQLEDAVRIAVQALLMVNSNTTDSERPNYTIGGSEQPSWLADKSTLNFGIKCFPQAPAERKGRMEEVLREKKALKAWKLRDRLGIEFRPTDNLENQLLFDPEYRKHPATIS